MGGGGAQMGGVGLSLRRLYYPANHTSANIPSAAATMARRRRAMKGLDNAACHLFRLISEACQARFSRGKTKKQPKFKVSFPPSDATQVRMVKGSGKRTCSHELELFSVELLRWLNRTENILCAVLHVKDLRCMCTR